MSDGAKKRILVPLFYNYYFFDLLQPVTKELVNSGFAVTLVTWDELIERKYAGIEGLKKRKTPRIVRSFWNRSNSPIFRFGLWITAWIWVSNLRRSYDCVILPFDNKPVWYVMSRLMRSIYCHSSTEFIDLELTLERERIKEKKAWSYRIFRYAERLLGKELLPRLNGEELKFFPHRLWVDRMMGWRAPNHLCGFSGVDLLTVAGSANKEVYEHAGIHRDKIVVTGSPLYDQLETIRAQFSDKKRQSFKSTLGLSEGSKIFVFFLSPSEFSEAQISEVESVVDSICSCYPDAQVVIKFHPKTNPKYNKIFRQTLVKYNPSLVLISEFSGDKFNAELILCADYVVQKQSTVGFIAMRLGVPILSYNLRPTNYEDDMYKILDGSLHVETIPELKESLLRLFESETIGNIKKKQTIACEKFCLDVDCATENIVREVKLLVG